MAYVYMCVHKQSKKFYIGYRCANLRYNRFSHIDFPMYKTSHPDIKQNFSNYDWFILAEFFDGDSAYDFEQHLINEYWNHPLIMNESCYFGKPRFKSKALSDTHKKAISKAQSKPKSESHKSNLAKANLGKHWYNNGIKSVQSKDCPEGFVPGRLVSNGSVFTSESAKNARKQVKNKSRLSKCSICGTEGAVNLLTRHHFLNCDSLVDHKLINVKSGELIEINKIKFKELYGSPLYHLLNGNVKTLKGWKLTHD